MNSTDNSGRLLERHPIIRSADVAEIEYTFLNTYGARRFDMRGRSNALKVHANYWQGSSTALFFCQHAGADVTIKYCEVNYFRQHFAVSGGMTLRTERHTHELSRSAPCLISANQPLVLETSGELDNLIVRIDRAPLISKLSAMTGKANLRFNPSPKMQSNPVGAARLERLIRLLATELEQDSVPSLFLSELEQAIAVAFVLANPQLLEDGQVDRPLATGCRQLRVAEDYIEENWDKPLTLEALAAATNVSARSLFYFFRKMRGKTPMQFLREVRLHHARQMLQHSRGVTVTEVAFACGFGNLGHFARDYRRAWGERPSDTKRNSNSRN